MVVADTENSETGVHNGESQPDMPPAAASAIAKPVAETPSTPFPPPPSVLSQEDEKEFEEEKEDNYDGKFPSLPFPVFSPSSQCLLPS